MIRLDKYSIGVGDRFTHQATAQLRACMLASGAGVDVIPVWNKSNREHTIIGSHPASVRAAADAAAKKLAWALPYYCDADHINLSTVDRFLTACDFYTIDVADFIGKPAVPSSIEAFIARHGELAGLIRLDEVDQTITITHDSLRHAASKFLFAVEEAGRIYRHIEGAKGKGTFITEISVDETDSAQSPAELLIILAAIADQQIPIQTIAPKFSGRFNKGIDYIGDIAQFSSELLLDIAVIRHAITAYSLEPNLKLSIHSGSDKFSIYPAIHNALQRTSAGIHVKTAGTTWLEEVIGLSSSGGAGLDLVREIYAEAYVNSAELCQPYATVVDIDSRRLPAPTEVSRWSGPQFAAALRHNPQCPSYNPHIRQLLHVGFKVAAKLGSRYLDLLVSNQEIIATNVTQNLFDRHIAPVFLGQPILFSTDQAPSALTTN
jgi:hypothetical protein